MMKSSHTQDIVHKLFFIKTLITVIFASVDIITVPASGNFSVDCRNSSQIISSLDVIVKTQTTSCPRHLCNISEHVNHTIQNQCKGKQFCVLSSDFNDDCLKQNGFLNLSYSCKSNGIYEQTCLNVDREVYLQECSQKDLILNKNSFEIDTDVKSCIANQEHIRAEVPCSTGNPDDICSFRPIELIKQYADCFRLNRLEIEYECKEADNSLSTTLTTTDYWSYSSSMEPNTVKSSKRENDHPRVSNIVGVVAIGMVIVLCIVAILVFIKIKRKKKGHRDVTEHDRIGLHDYTDIQDISIPNEINQAEHRVSHAVNNSIPDTEETDQSNENTEMPQLNKTKSFDMSASYAILDPMETGYNRSAPNDDYDLAVPIAGVKKIWEQDAVNEYAIANHQTDKHLNDVDSNVYSHSVDNVYDTAGQNKHPCRNDDNYDHFIVKDN